MHLPCWHFESYFIDIAYNYVRRTTHFFLNLRRRLLWFKDAYGEYSLRLKCHGKRSWSINRSKFLHNWRSADVRQTQENIALRLDDICKILPSHFNSEIHCSHKWCYRQFTHISRMLKRKHPTGEETEESTAASRSSTWCPQKEKKWIAISTEECFFLCEKGFVVVAEEAIKERTREKCDLRHTNLKKNW